MMIIFTPESFYKAENEIHHDDNLFVIGGTVWSGATSDDKVGNRTTIDFQCLGSSYTACSTDWDY